MFNFSFNEISDFTKESTLETFGQGFVEKALKVSDELDFQGLPILFFLLKGIYTGQYALEDMKFTEQQKAVISELYQNYTQKIFELNDRFNDLANGHAGKVIDGQLIYDDKKYPLSYGNNSISKLPELQLLSEFLGFDYELRFATSAGEAILANSYNPHFSANYTGAIAEKYYNYADKLARIYEQRLIEAGYDIEAKRQKEGKYSYFVSYGCEQFDFPEQFKANGSAYVIPKEEAFQLLAEWDKGKKAEPYMSCRFTKEYSYLTINDIALEDYKKKGFHWSFPGCPTITLSPDYFNSVPNKTFFEDGEERYEFCIPR